MWVRRGEGEEEYLLADEEKEEHLFVDEEKEDDLLISLSTRRRRAFSSTILVLLLDDEEKEERASLRRQGEGGRCESNTNQKKIKLKTSLSHLYHSHSGASWKASYILCIVVLIGSRAGTSALVHAVCRCMTHH